MARLKVCMPAVYGTQLLSLLKITAFDNGAACSPTYGCPHYWHWPGWRCAGMLPCSEWYDEYATMLMLMLMLMT